MTGSSSARTERASLSGAATLSQGRTHYRVKAVHMYIKFFLPKIFKIWFAQYTCTLVIGLVFTYLSLKLRVIHICDSFNF